jgi:hypothetical protein
MARWAFAATLSVALACATAATPQPAERGPPAPQPPPAATPAPPPPPPAVAKRCTLPGGGIRVLTHKQKKCRVANACACADPCSPCA